MGTCCSFLALHEIRRNHSAKAGYNYIPVVVASEAISAGTIVTWDMLSQRAFPEQLVTGSVIKPESAGDIVGHKVLMPLQAGDPLHWTQFDFGPVRGP
jgi:pilus assembly protein CpaB